MKLQAHHLEPLHPYTQRQIEHRQFSGISWCVEQQGVVIDQAAFGYSDAAQLTPIQDDTLYRLYSMTKSVVSVRCLQLIDSGALKLDDPISHWLPAFADQQVLSDSGALVPLQRAITIEDLLTHRSGLSYDFLPDCSVADQYRAARFAADGARPLAELVHMLGEIPLACQPGERWHYSYSTDVLAHIIELICQRSLGESLDESLFAPLGMSETGFQVDSDARHRLATMYGQRELGEVPEVVVSSDSSVADEPVGNKLQIMDVSESYPADNPNFARGGIGLFSTMNDYRRFMHVLMQGTAPSGQVLLSEPLLDMSWRNRLSDAQMPICIGQNCAPGYGWNLTGRVMSDLSKAEINSVADEGGWSGAASTYFWIDRKHGISGIVMTQYLGSAIMLGPGMQSLVYGSVTS